MTSRVVTDLDATRILAAIDAANVKFGRPLHIVEATTSTNADAKRALIQGAQHGSTFIADSQSSGRGRGDHSWYSPPGENVYMSVAMRPTSLSSTWTALPLVVGLAVATVVERKLNGRITVGIKWPNDVLVDNAKVAGILVEGLTSGNSTISSLVVGIGLNVRTSCFPAELKNRATSLALLRCKDLNRSSIIAEVLIELARHFELFQARRLSPFLDELRRRDALQGKRIVIDPHQGIAMGLDDQGRILLERAGGDVIAIGSGEARAI